MRNDADYGINMDDLRYGVNWVMVDDSYPRFNLWRCDIANGESYIESFGKDANPNVIASWERSDNEMKQAYIDDCIRKGQTISMVAERLGYAYETIKTYFNKSKLKYREL